MCNEDKNSQGQIAVGTWKQKMREKKKTETTNERLDTYKEITDANDMKTLTE